MSVDIERLRELEAKVSPENWVVQIDSNFDLSKFTTVNIEHLLMLIEISTTLPALLDEIERLREKNEEIAKYCCEQYEMWKRIRNDPNSDKLRQDKAASSMLAYLDIGKRIDEQWRGKDE